MALRTWRRCITRGALCCSGRFAMLLILALAALLAGCGQAAVSSQMAASGSTATAASTPTSTRFNGAASTACPVSQAPADAGSFKPDVIVNQNPQDAGAAQPITLAQGQHLEIRLQPGYTWELAASDPDHVLASTSSEGWYDADVSACIWRFAAAGKGNAQLNYQGALVCPPLELCPSTEQSASYHVTIR